MSYYFDFGFYCMNNCLLLPDIHSHFIMFDKGIVEFFENIDRVNASILLQVSSKSYLTLLLGIQMYTHTIAYYR